MFYYFILSIFYIPFHFLYPTKVIGKKNLPKKGAFILTPNHQTINDPVIIAYKLTRRRMRYMAKSTLFKNKLFGAYLKGLGVYPVNRDVADLGAIKKTLKNLKNKKPICIFPEGARLKSDESNDIKNGVAMFALKANVPVVPAFFVKKTNCFVFNKLLVGKPINLSEMPEFANKKVDKDLIEKASAIIKLEMFNLKNDYQNKKNKNK